MPVAVHSPHQGGQTQGCPFLIPMGHLMLMVGVVCN
jgi:hypothetical protein